MPGAAINIFLGLCAVSAAAGAIRARFPARPRNPLEGQSGKDLVWVPTPPALVEEMLDMACVTANDYVIDLGSGDGRLIIAAAKRGARGLGIEYDAKLLEASRRTAADQGVADLATFVQGDLYEADLSQATVLTLFLLPDALRRLAPKFGRLRPGTRIVTNRYGIEGWPADRCERFGGSSETHRTALLYTVRSVPAGVS